MIDFACSSCQKLFRVKDELAGKQIRCPSCAHVLRIPAQHTVAVQSTQQQEPLAEAPTLPPVDAADTTTILPAQATNEAVTIPPANNPQDLPTVPSVERNNLIVFVIFLK